jgi:Leucine Rich repeat
VGSSTGFSDEGASSLCRLFERNTTLLSLDVSHNAVSDAGGQDWIVSIVGNETISEVQMEKTDISEETKANISAVAERNAASRTEAVLLVPFVIGGRAPREGAAVSLPAANPISAALFRNLVARSAAHDEDPLPFGAVRVLDAQSHLPLADPRDADLSRRKIDPADHAGGLLCVGADRAAVVYAWKAASREPAAPLGGLPGDVIKLINGWVDFETIPDDPDSLHGWVSSP